MRQRRQPAAMQGASTWAPVLACVAIAGLGGCGPSERAPDAASVAERFHAALGQRDGEAACDLVDEHAKSTLEQEKGEPCAEAILMLELSSDGTAAETSVYVTNASVAFAEGGVTFLNEGSDGWSVAAAGCVSTAPGQPYDCALGN